MAKCESRRCSTAQARKNAASRPARRPRDALRDRVDQRNGRRAERRRDGAAEHHVGDLVARHGQDRADATAVSYAPRTKLIRYIGSGEYMKNFGDIAASRMSRRSRSAGRSTKCSSMWKW